MIEDIIKVSLSKLTPDQITAVKMAAAKKIQTMRALKTPVNKTVVGRTIIEYAEMINCLDDSQDDEPAVVRDYKHVYQRPSKEEL